MLHFLKTFLTGITIPESYHAELLAHAEKLNALPAWKAQYERLLNRDYEQFADVLGETAAVAETQGCHKFTAHFLLFAFAAKTLKERYEAVGIDEEIYWTSMKDLRWKFDECLDVHGIPGTFVAFWYPGFYNMTRFALGRLQYEHARFDMDEYTCAGITLHRGDDVINCHIPSCGPLTEESRMDSYRRAWEFYKKDFPSGIVPIVCSSWLLYPEHFDFLPAHSNILSFMRDFNIIRSGVDEKFGNAWRVFGAAAQKPASEWPRDTSVRRAFADRILAGKPVGSGYGILLFDGEKILR